MPRTPDEWEPDEEALRRGKNLLQEAFAEAGEAEARKQAKIAAGALYRAQLECQVGRDALEGKIPTPDGVQPIEYAVFQLLHAIEDLAKAMEAGDQDTEDQEEAQ